MLRLLPSVGVAILSASTALAANTVNCGSGNLCPEDLPCCSRELVQHSFVFLELTTTELQNTASVVLEHTVSVAATLCFRILSSHAYQLRCVKLKIISSPR